MYLVTELGRAGRENIWLEVGEDVRTERIEVRASWSIAKFFFCPARPSKHFIIWPLCFLIVLTERTRI